MKVSVPHCAWPIDFGLSAGTRIWCLVRHPLPLIGIGWGFLLKGDIRPQPRVFGIEAQPLLSPWLGVRLDRVYGAFWLANPAIDAFVGMDDQHVADDVTDTLELALVASGLADQRLVADEPAGEIDQDRREST